MADEQIATWVKAKASLKNAEDELRTIRTRVESRAKSLENWRSIQPDGTKRYQGANEPFELSSWPGPTEANDALKACHEALENFTQAGRYLAGARQVGRCMAAAPRDFRSLRRRSKGIWIG